MSLFKEQKIHSLKSDIVRFHSFQGRNSLFKSEIVLTLRESELFTLLH